MATMLVLTAMTGTQIGKRYTLAERVGQVGSGAGCQIVIHEREIAPRHAEFQQILDRWFIVPLAGGGRGISLNGSPLVSRSRLNPNDLLTLGAVTYRVSFAEMTERAVGAESRQNDGVPRLGEYFIRRGLMSRDQVTHTARRQTELLHRGRTVPFGQVAYELGYISRAQLDSALAEQHDDFNQRMRD